MKGRFNISEYDLQQSKTENLIRLANFLRIETNGLNHNQIARVIHWRITQQRFIPPKRIRKVI